MKSNIKILKYYKKIAKSSNAHNIKNTIIKYTFIKTDIAAYTAYKIID